MCFLLVCVFQLKETLAADAMVWCAQEGVLMGVGGESPSSFLVHAPVALLPTAFPHRAFDQVQYFGLWALVYIWVNVWVLWVYFGYEFGLLVYTRTRADVLVSQYFGLRY